MLRQDYDKQGGQRAKKEGREPPKEAAAILGLSQSGIDQRESAPADEKLGVLHFCIPFFLYCICSTNIACESASNEYANE